MLNRSICSNWGEGLDLPPGEALAFAEAEAKIKAEITAVIEAAQSQNVSLRLLDLAAAFNLSRFELDVLLIALAPNLDLRYERLYAYLQDDVTRKRPSVNLALDLLGQTGPARLQKLTFFAEDAPLRKHDLLDLVTEPRPAHGPLLSHTLRVDDTVAAWLLGRYQPHADLADQATLVFPMVNERDQLLVGEALSDLNLRGSHFEIESKSPPNPPEGGTVLANETPGTAEPSTSPQGGTGTSFSPLWGDGGDTQSPSPQRSPAGSLSSPPLGGIEGGRPLLVFHGPDDVAQQATARLLAAQLDRPLLQVDLSALAATDQPPAQAVTAALRDARLINSILLLTGFDACLTADGHPPRDLFAALRTHSDLVILAGRTRWQAQGNESQRLLYWLEFPVPDYSQRLKLWQHFLGSDERRGTSDERRGTRDERRGTRDKRRVTSDERRGTRDENLTTLQSSNPPEQLTMNNEQLAMNNELQSSNPSASLRASLPPFQSSNPPILQPSNLPTFQPSNLPLPLLANQFALTTGQIRDAMATARGHAAQRGEALAEHHLFLAARAHSNPRLEMLARKLTPRYEWGDIILPDDQRTMLREIVETVRGRPRVLDEWGVGRKLASSAAVTVLFAGDPGTGKTMAAEVMANELNLDLYKIDLSTVVSKYIGETEKNLEKIFSEAESSNAILFFDEADAIFGKRSEVKDAHDRYANIEISYLLQRMESYHGVTILATNLRANLDEAFTRRLHFVVDFPFPEAADRLRIWQTLFPPDVPRAGELDFAPLAERYKLAGGNIRNVIVSAAYLAAANGGSVTMGYLLHGLRRELQKMGRLIGEGELRIG
jgi:hypothetical protein